MDCKYFIKPPIAMRGGGAGRCRRYPPQVYVITRDREWTQGGAYTTTESEYPITQSNGWCGEGVEQDE